MPKSFKSKTFGGKGGRTESTGCARENCQRLARYQSPMNTKSIELLCYWCVIEEKNMLELRNIQAQYSVVSGNEANLSLLADTAELLAPSKRKSVRIRAKAASGFSTPVDESCCDLPFENRCGTCADCSTKLSCAKRKDEHLQHKLSIGKSSMMGAGNGLFLLRPVKMDDPIIEYTGHTSKKRPSGNEYTSHVSSEKYITAKAGSFCGSANHSCTPNCDLRKLLEPSENGKGEVERLYVVPLMNLKEGDECFLDYNKGLAPSEDKFDFGEQGCLCGAFNCKYQLSR